MRKLSPKRAELRHHQRETGAQRREFVTRCGVSRPGSRRVNCFLRQAFWGFVLPSKHPMRFPSKIFMAALIAAAMGPLALAVWNESLGRRGFASPVGGPRWFSPQPGFFEARGFRDPELSPVGSLFNWTEGTESLLRFPRVDRRQEAEVTLRVQGGAGSTAASSIAISVDGVEAARLPIPREPKRVVVDLPPKPGRGAVVAIRVENAPGVMVENVRLGAIKGTLPIPSEALGAMAFASFAAWVAISGTGLSMFASLGITAIVATSLGWLSARGGAFLGRYSETLSWMGLAVLILGLLLRRVPNLAWRRAFIAVLGASALKLALLSHPQLIDADASQHAGNMARLLAGEWIFTSATPPPAIKFPYPPLLSAVALPFSRLPAEDWVTALRVIILLAEIAGSFVFARAVAAFWGNSLGALTFALCSLSTEGVAILFVGNLSNLFGDALLFAACGFLLRRRDGPAFLALLGAFLSHFGDLLMGAPLGLVLALLGREEPRSPARRMAPALGALIAAFVLYYRHFMPLYMEVLGRLTTAREAAGEGPMNAPLAVKVVRLAGEQWGITLFITGLVLLGLSRWPEDRRMRRALGLWGLVVAALTILGLLTPVQVRVGLAARPVIAALIAAALGGLWARGRSGRAAAVAAVSVLVGCAWLVAASFYPPMRL